MQDFVSFALRILAVVGVVAALIVVAALFVGILRSIWKVTVGKGTLVLAFSGSERGTSIAGILAQQLASVEDEWRVLSRKIRRLEAGAGDLAPGSEKAPVLIDMPRGESAGDLPMTQSEQLLVPEQREYLYDDPQEGMTLGEMSIAGVRFAPDSFFAAFHRLRGILARRTIRGSFHEFGSVARLSCTLVWPRAAALRARRPRQERTETRVVLCRADTPQELLDAIDNMAFLIASARLHMRFGMEPQVGALTWGAYRAFLDGYKNHQLFAQTADLQRRERAIERYREALGKEPGYTLVHYNLGTLLYNRYTALDNDESIEHLREAATSPDPTSSDPTTRALALAALTLAYCQQVHRFGHPVSNWGSLAVVASEEAYSLKPDLGQTRFARGFAFQILRQASEALAWYRQVLELSQDSLGDRRMMSYAHNNTGYLHMELGDLETADQHLRSAIKLFPGNKMAYTNLGEAARRRGKYEKALELYGRAIELDPRYVSASDDTGIVYLAMASDRRNPDRVADNLGSARRWHGRAIALIPEGAHRHRAYVHDRFAKACRDFDFPDEAQGWAQEAARESTFLAEPTSASRET